MNQIKSNNALINWELVSINPNDKNWTWKELFYFWGCNIQSVIAFSLIASLYLVYELNIFVVLFGSVIIVLTAIMNYFIIISKLLKEELLAKVCS